MNINGKTSIKQSGDDAHAFYSYSANSEINLNTADIKINSEGSGSGHAFYANYGGVININYGLDHRLVWRDAG